MVSSAKDASRAKARLGSVLATLRQGDLIALGAVSMVGRGPSAVLDAAGGEPGGPDDVWSVTIESDVGWYVIVSQDCDVVRDVADEPCLLVCPLTYVPESRWLALRHGPYSPREFPFPDEKLSARPEGQRPVANLRFVTSVVKEALLHEDVESLRPLSGRQHELFGAWVGRRFARAAHDDAMEADVLGPAEACILAALSAATAAQQAGKTPTSSGKLVLAAEEWYVAGTDKLVAFHVVVSEASLRHAGYDLDEEDDAGAGSASNDVEAGRKFIEKKLRSRLPPDKGYAVSLEVWTLDQLSAAAYRELSPWVFERPGDPLAD